jgi:hypothetical protein
MDDDDDSQKMRLSTSAKDSMNDDHEFFPAMKGRRDGEEDEEKWVDDGEKTTMADGR